MWKRWIRNSWPIGCKIGTNYLRLAQIQDRNGATEVVATATQLPAGLSDDHPEYARAISDLLSRMLREGRFRGRRVVSCLPNHRLMYRMMRLAAMPAEEMAQAVHWKAASELGLKADSFKSAFLQLGTALDRDKGKIEIAAIAAECASVEQHVQILTGAGLHPAAIDASTCAAIRCLKRLPWSDGPPALVLELGISSAILAVVGGGLRPAEAGPRPAEAGRLVFIRPLQAHGSAVGLGGVHQLLANMLNIPVAEAAQMANSTCEGRDANFEEALVNAECMYARDLARELVLSLHYLTGTLGKPVQPIGVVIGPAVLRPQALETLSAQTGISFTTVDHLPKPAWENSVRSADPDSPPHCWLAPIGLSLYDQSAAAEGSRRFSGKDPAEEAA